MFSCCLVNPAWTQDAPPSGKNVPIYRVTVIERTVRAVNYQYRGDPTQIDFTGTVLLPLAKGQATVQSKSGRTSIDAHFEHFTPSQQYGAGYLTYVLWAISPEGHAKNLGELIPSGSGKAAIQVTTELQAFGLIVTAEPYSAVRQPSDVVVAENQIRPDTIGQSEPIQAKYELLPRGQYTFAPSDAEAVLQGPKVSQSRYESTLELYQARNAVQIARSLGADKYAPDVMQKADAELSNAQALSDRKAKRDDIVTAARAAAETAEDARLVALDRQRASELSAAKQQAAAKDQALADAQAQAAAATDALREAQAKASIEQAERQAAQQRLERETAARRRAEAEAQALAHPAPPPPSAAEQPSLTDPEKQGVRTAMLRQLSQSMPTLDTPRGLTVTVSDADFRGAALQPSADAAIARVASVLIAHPGLSIDVEGHTGAEPAAPEERQSYERAVAVRDALVHHGVPANWIAARGAAAENPVASNANPAGRERNRRVEIVLSGDPIGSMASWDRTYNVMPSR
jgi:outer membrane protein OmpA-like peptidoglycan-associated protein